jgi:hypothetical protein
VSELLNRLLHANHTLGQLVEMLSASPTRITPEHLTMLLSELLRVGARIQAERIPENDPTLDLALHQYRTHLECLRDLLPSLQASLLTERAKLEAERSHLESAYAWAESTRCTK